MTDQLVNDRNAACSRKPIKEELRHDLQPVESWTPDLLLTNNSLLINISRVDIFKRSARINISLIHAHCFNLHI
jgi:hypothetical protein